MPLLLLLLLASLPVQLLAQFITGKIVDEEGQPVVAATVALVTAKDSTTLKLDVTDANGRFSFSAKEGHYNICASHIGYIKTCAAYQVGTLPGNGALVMRMEKQSSSLQQVTVAASRPVIEVKGDRMIIHVEASLNNIGTNALELLRKSPGVNLDREDNISLNGKNGVQVLIDGRQSPLNGADLSAYLSSLQSAQIESIEMISNPSARYDAAGNGGIINIRLKKNKSYGTNGSVNAGYGIGSYAKYNSGFTVNHRNRLLNIFGTYNYAHNKNLVSTNTYRLLADTGFDQKAKRIITDKPHNIQAGMDLFINPTSTLGFIFNALPGRFVIDNNSTTTIQHKDNTIADKRLAARGLGKNKRKNTSFNINYRYATAAKALDIDADYAHYNMLNDQFQPNYYFSSNHSFLYSRIYHMVSPSDITMHSAKLNYDVPAAKGKISMGGKYGMVESDNNLQRFDVLSTGEKLDSGRSNHFTYKEKISALYAGYTREYRKLSLQIGLRAENTEASGFSSGYQWQGRYVLYDTGFTKQYLNFFPTASLTYRQNEDRQWNFNVGRRIDRPAYADLNPFEFKVDEYVYRKGNIQLRPQYTTVAEAIHIYKNKLTMLASFSYVSDVFTQIFDTVEVSKSFITKTNVATQQLVNVSVNYVFQKGRYNAFMNVNPYYNKYRSNFGKDRNLHLEAFSVTVKTQHNYKFKNGLAAEVSMLYNSPGIGLGFFKGPGFGSVDIALSRSMLENRLQLKAAISDLFFTNKLKGTSYFAGQAMAVQRTFEPRLLRINMAYRFGSSTVKAQRQRKTLLEEENKRLQSGN